MKILVTANNMWNIRNFRKHLVLALLASGHEVVVLAPFDGYENEVSSWGCKLSDLKMDPVAINPIKIILLLRQFHKKINIIQPDMILSFTIKNNVFGGIVARFKSIPFVPNITGLGTAFTSSTILIKVLTKLLCRIAFNKNEIIFFQNSDDKSLFQNLGIVSSKHAFVIPGSGIDLDAYKFCKLQNDDNPLFVMISRLIKDKGAEEFLDASRIVKKLNPNAKFLLVGSYDIKDKRAISKTKLDQWKSDGVGIQLNFGADIPELLKQATAIVLPSYREGAPRSLIEASSTGRPCISTNTPGCNYVIDDNVTGLLCKPRDTTDLAEKILKFIKLPYEEKVRIGVEARKKMEREFSVDIVISHYTRCIEYYQKKSRLPPNHKKI